MKKAITLLLASTFIILGNAQEETSSTSDFSHKVEITPLVGYMMNERLDLVQGDMTFKNNINYGLALAYNIKYGSFIEATYTFSSSETDFTANYPGYVDNNFKTGIQNIQISFLQEFKGDRVRPFATLGIGTTGFIPKEDNYESWWSFSMNFGAGVKIGITETIGIRLQARMLVPFYQAGTETFCGGGDCGGPLVTSSSIMQGDFMGGLIIGF